MKSLKRVMAAAVFVMSASDQGLADDQIHTGPITKACENVKTMGDAVRCLDAYTAEGRKIGNTFGDIVSRVITSPEVRNGCRLNTKYVLAARDQKIIIKKNQTESTPVTPQFRGYVKGTLKSFSSCADAYQEKVGSEQREFIGELKKFRMDAATADAQLKF